MEKGSRNCVVIESPFSGALEENIRYAKLCMLHSLMKGEAPFLSHLLYPLVLDDNDLDERVKGLEANYDWITRCSFMAIYIDRGISKGMLGAMAIASKIGIYTETRKLPGFTVGAVESDEGYAELYYSLRDRD